MALPWEYGRFLSRFLPQILGTNSDPSMMIEIPNLTSAKSVVGFPFPLHNMFSLVVTIHVKNTPEKRGVAYVFTL